MDAKEEKKTKKMPTKEARVEAKAALLADLKKREKALKEKQAILKRELRSIQTPTKRDRTAEAARLCLIAKGVLKQIELGNLAQATFDDWMDKFLTKEADRKRYYGEGV